jgi:hypothetical protein
VYVDSAYLANYYLNEPDSAAMRDAIRRSPDLALPHGLWSKVGEPAIWSNDRHLLRAAAHFGIAARSV